MGIKLAAFKYDNEKKRWFEEPLDPNLEDVITSGKHFSTPYGPLAVILHHDGRLTLMCDGLTAALARVKDEWVLHSAYEDSKVLERVGLLFGKVMVLSLHFYGSGFILYTGLNPSYSNSKYNTSE
jgi:hypothetical protein